jgi:hypothetical protein
MAGVPGPYLIGYASGAAPTEKDPTVGANPGGQAKDRSENEKNPRYSVLAT